MISKAEWRIAWDQLEYCLATMRNRGDILEYMEGIGVDADLCNEMLDILL